ncbi:MAG: hypothetical protein GSR86_01330 [Desulfurococcales archaeon]|nr:hypothetical protein [Desulfurococcales archaeon]
MRILLLHASEFSYETIKKAIKKPPDPPGSYACSNCLVVFTTIEEEDTEALLGPASDSILEVIDKVKPGEVVIYPYAHLSSRLARPTEAHKLLVKLEEVLGSTLELKIHRSPFGWYKRFSITVYGHPLSELSREFSGAETVVSILRDAVRRGVLPEGLTKEGLGDDVESIASRLKLEDAMVRRLIHDRIARKLLGMDSRYHELTVRRLGDGLEELRLLLEACRLDGVNIEVAAGPDRILISDKGVDELYNFKRIDKIPLTGISDASRTGHVILYKFRSSAYRPIAVVEDGRRCIGPLSNIIKSIIDEELAKKEEDNSYTPMIPPWMHYITVALIPVAEGQKDTANSLARRLEQYGVGVLLLDDTGTRLGQRIRSAARLWIPIIAVIGEREAREGLVTVRRRWEPGKQEAITVDEFIDEATRVSRSGYVINNL